jgi:hypothetical protein
MVLAHDRHGNYCGQEGKKINRTSDAKLLLTPARTGCILSLVKEMKNMKIYETACRVVDAAGQAGGIDEVRRIAERGWPCDVDGAQASPEMLAAIQDRARTIVAEVDGEVQS